MKPVHSSKKDEGDQKVIKLLQELGSIKAEYPPELLRARRAAFLGQIDQLRTGQVEEGLAPGDQDIVRLLGNLKSAQAEYPPELLSATRSAFLGQIETARNLSLLDRVRVSIASLFQGGITIPHMPLPDLMRASLVVASLIVAAVIGTLLFSQAGPSLSPFPGVAQPTRILPTMTHEAAAILCKPGDQRPPCSSRDVDLGQDLADQGNGLARPAVSKDAQSPNGRVHQAAYVNDGHSGPSWVSRSANSWIKIDLGRATAINSVSLQKGNLGSSEANNPGQFEIAVALSDDYSDGNSSNDDTEYAQVFRSEQTGFSGMISNAETIRAMFPPIQARFVKITFEKAGAAIDEVGVFMVQPPELTEHPTRTSPDGGPGRTETLVSTSTLSPIATRTATPGPTGTWLATATPTPFPTLLPTRTITPFPTDTALPNETSIPLLTSTPYPSNTPVPTNTRPPADTPTPVPAEPLATETPIPLATVVPPTAIAPTAQAPVGSTGPIIITSHDQTLTFTCNGNAVEVRGHANTVTLLGSCSSITVTGNRNLVFWQSGSPIITNLGKDNIISQM